MTANNTIRTTAQGQVLENIKMLARLLGKCGTLAGGAIRDLYCGVTPKDYDLFVYSSSDWENLDAQLLDTEGVEYKTGNSKNDSYYGGLAEDIKVSTFDYKGLEIQLIHFDTFLRSPRDIVSGFDFTINMMTYSEDHGFIMTDEAKRSLALEELELNPQHMQRIVKPKPENFKFIAQGLLKIGRAHV